MSVSPISLSGMSAPFEMRPRKPASTGATDRVGELYWRISTDPADLARVYEVLCVHYDGVLIVTFKCYADDSQVCDHLYKLELVYLPVGKYCVYPRMVYRQAVAYIEYDLYPFHIATNLHGVFIAQYIALRHESTIVVHM